MGSHNILRNLETLSTLRWEYEKLDALISRYIRKDILLPERIKELRSQIVKKSLKGLIENNSDFPTKKDIQHKASFAYHYLDLVVILEKAEYISRTQAIKLIIRVSSILNFS